MQDMQFKTKVRQLRSAVMIFLSFVVLVTLHGCSLDKPIDPVTCEVARQVVARCDAQGLAPTDVVDVCKGRDSTSDSDEDQ